MTHIYFNALRLRPPTHLKIPIFFGVQSGRDIFEHGETIAEIATKMDLGYIYNCIKPTKLTNMLIFVQFVFICEVPWGP